MGISEKWNPRPGTVGGTQYSRPGTHLTNVTRDPRPETLKVGPGTLDSESGFSENLLSFFFKPGDHE